MTASSAWAALHLLLHPLLEALQGQSVGPPQTSPLACLLNIVYQFQPVLLTSLSNPHTDTVVWPPVNGNQSECVSSPKGKKMINELCRGYEWIRKMGRGMLVMDSHL